MRVQSTERSRNKSDRKWKEDVVIKCQEISQYLPGRTEEKQENLWMVGSLGRKFSPRPPEHKAGVPPARSRPQAVMSYIGSCVGKLVRRLACLQLQRDSRQSTH